MTKVTLFYTTKCALYKCKQDNKSKFLLGVFYRKESAAVLHKLDVKFPNPLKVCLLKLFMIHYMY